jgi:hypothetical protein
LQHLKAQSSKALDATVQDLVGLVNGRVLASDIYTDLGSLDARHAVRLAGRHPPGASDAKKDENKYGDLIAWGEIVAHAADPAIKAAVILTNDNKPDWVFAPPAILDESGRQASNTADRGTRVVKPLPLLVHEIRRLNPDIRLHIVNIAYLAHLLHGQVGADFRTFFEAYRATGERAIGPPAAETAEPAEAATGDQLTPPAPAPAGFRRPSRSMSRAIFSAMTPRRSFLPSPWHGKFLASTSLPRTGARLSGPSRRLRSRQKLRQCWLATPCRAESGPTSSTSRVNF